MHGKVRGARPEDAQAIASIYGHYVETSPATFELVSPSAMEMAARIERVIQFFPWLVLEGADGIEGYAYGGTHRAREAYRWAVDTSVYVAADRRGGGVGSALYLRLLSDLRRQGFTNAFAGITLPNAASVRLHEKMGFRHVGTYTRIGYKLNAWHDTGWWQMELATSEDAPTEPVAWSTLQPIGATESDLVGG